MNLNDDVLFIIFSYCFKANKQCKRDSFYKQVEYTSLGVPYYNQIITKKKWYKQQK